MRIQRTLMTALNTFRAISRGATVVTALVIVFAMTIAISGCEQGTNQAVQKSPAAEESNISSKNFGAYELHFNAMSTDQLQPEIARAYNIARSKNRALLTVSILKSNGALSGDPVSGSVKVKAANLTGQIKNMTLRQIQDGDSIYYIGDTGVANGETLIFDIDAIPVDETDVYSVRFSRQFFAN
jgi:hypothetical protein